MNTLSFRYLGIIVLLLLLLPTGRADDADRLQENDGTLVVLVTEGDVDNSPATNAYVEAYGFVRKYDSKKSFVLKNPTSPGRYETLLPPGVYDVFVSEGTSVPVCKRTLIKAGSTSYWTLKLEHDYVYLQK